MVSGRWVINPAFLELGKLADRKVPDVVGKGTEVNQVMMALAIINSLHWSDYGKLIYPEDDHFKEQSWDEEQAGILVDIVDENISPEWVKENVKTTVFPHLPWGGNPITISDTAKDYLQYGIDGTNLRIVSDNSDNDLVDHVTSGFRYPIYGFIKMVIPQSINKKVVL
jgi:hypothetical protein